jgi:hypothetical protein
MGEEAFVYTTLQSNAPDDRKRSRVATNVRLMDMMGSGWCCIRPSFPAWCIIELTSAACVTLAFMPCRLDEDLFQKPCNVTSIIAAFF